MDLIAQFVDRARRSPKRIVYPEGDDARIVKAAALAVQRGIAKPTVLGKPEVVKALASRTAVDLTGVGIVDPDSPAETEAFAKDYSASRPEISVAVAKRLVKRPLFFSSMMVKTGTADGMVGGVASTTASLIQAAGLTIGFEPGVSTASSFFIMVVPECLGEKDKVLVFADAAVCIDPNAQQLAEIAVTTGRSARALLGIEPRIALLSFSTKGSASHPHVDKVVEALKLARALDPSLAMDGEFQADSALVPRVAARKVKGESAVAGKANVLIFPDLDAANIAYKLTQYLGNARAYGPILQGFAKPVCDLSRGASVDDILGVTAIIGVKCAASG